jgi:hypothetical protein
VYEDQLVISVFHVLLVCAGGATPSIDAMLAVASDQLAEQLDAAHGSEVVDPSIFRAHAAKYEVRRCEFCHQQKGFLLRAAAAAAAAPGFY